jgi:hypothetical protein
MGLKDGSIASTRYRQIRKKLNMDGDGSTAPAAEATNGTEPTGDAPASATKPKAKRASPNKDPNKVTKPRAPRKPRKKSDAQIAKMEDATAIEDAGAVVKHMETMMSDADIQTLTMGIESQGAGQNGGHEYEEFPSYEVEEYHERIDFETGIGYPIEKGASYEVVSIWFSFYDIGLSFELQRIRFAAMSALLDLASPIPFCGAISFYFGAIFISSWESFIEHWTVNNMSVSKYL